jgi:hypothetical protein
VLQLAISGAGGQQTLLFTREVLINRAPEAGADTVNVKRDISLDISWAELLRNDSDPDGDPLQMLGCGPVTRAGGALVVAAGQVTYAPPAGFTGVDQFTYRVADGRGGESAGTVTLRVLGPGGLAVTEFAPAKPGSAGVVRLLLAAEPNQRYQVQASANLSDWNELGSAQADANGWLTFSETQTLQPLCRFFRALKQ